MTMNIKFSNNSFIHKLIAFFRRFNNKMLSISNQNSKPFPKRKNVGQLRFLDLEVFLRNLIVSAINWLNNGVKRHNLMISLMKILNEH